MAGFFKLDRPAAKKPGAHLRLDCTTCGLDKEGCRTPRMEPSGNGRKKILVIAEAPGATEDARGVQLVGDAGKYLREVMEDYGFSLDRDCRKINAVNCYPPKNRTPTDLEIACCRSRVWDEIRSFQPQVIILLGNAAMESFLAHRLPKSSTEDAAVGSMAVWRGLQIPDRETGAWVCPTYHPSYVLREEKNGAVEVLFRQDLKAALELSERYAPEPWPEEEQGVEVSFDPQRIKAYLRQLNVSEAEFAFDYETTGLKPYAQGHKILCCAISTDGITAFSFPMMDEVKYDVLQCLMNRGGKIAQNMQFEHIWTWVLLGYPVENWAFDTMLASHIINNQTRTGLKHQAYTNFGRIDYASHISPFLKGSDEKDANSFNRLAELDPDGNYDKVLRHNGLELTWRDLLLYCGVDAMLEMRLANAQRKKITPQNPAYRLMHNGAIALAQASMSGIRVDVDYCHQQSNHLKRRISYCRSKIESSEAGQVWRGMFGSKVNLGSNDQLGKVLFGHYGLTTEVKTKSGKASTSKASLESLDHPLVHDVLEMRKLEKIDGTYLGGWIREVRDGFMHPFFHLHKVITFRSSSANPNFQNIPTRDREAKRITRRAIIPRPGHQILEVDFSGIEVRIAACYHKDPTMLAYIKDPSKDMHRDMAIQLFRTGPDNWTKPLRQAAKNKFVFPEFYGDYYINCATGLWSDSQGEKLKNGKDVHEHLAEQGFRTLADFTEHVKDVEEDFWKRRFKVYDQWKKKHVSQYHSRGYIDLHTGFRCQGVMAKNDVINYVVQGAAFHCLLWTFTELMKIFNNKGLRSCIIGQIHDSVVIDADPREVPEILASIKWLVGEQLRKAFPWIIVPMDVEAEITEVNQSWYHKKEIKL